MAYTIEDIEKHDFVDIGHGPYDVRLNEAHGGYVFLLLEGDDELRLVKVHPRTEVEYDEDEQMWLLAPEDLIRRRDA